jgi:pimeloyl-ACP methyl ester carboxylesterase
VACLYAGVRPQRVARLVNLEGFGLPAVAPEQAPKRYAQWLDELRIPPTMQSYDSIEAVAARLRKTNPRLDAARAHFLAGHWARRNEKGAWEILGDPAHKLSNPVLYRAEEALACWRSISAPVLWVEAADTDAWRWFGRRENWQAEMERRRACIPNVRHCLLADAGHMLHHDQPEQLAQLIEDFLA